MSEPKQRTAIFFLAIAQLSTFVLVIVLLSRVPPYEQVNQQHEQLKVEIVERLINSPEFQNTLKATHNNTQKLNDMRSIIQDAVRMEIAKVYNRPSSFMETGINQDEAQLAAKQ